jgi:hypothetical protein
VERERDAEEFERLAQSKGLLGALGKQDLLRPPPTKEIPTPKTS